MHSIRTLFAAAILLTAIASACGDDGGGAGGTGGTGGTGGAGGTAGTGGTGGAGGAGGSAGTGGSGGAGGGGTGGDAGTTCGDDAPIQVACGAGQCDFGEACVITDQPSGPRFDCVRPPARCCGIPRCDSCNPCPADAQCTNELVGGQVAARCTGGSGGMDGGSLTCSNCPSGSTCVEYCDGNGANGHIECVATSLSCSPGTCSSACESALCRGDAGVYQCQNGAFCAPAASGAFLCQGP